MPEFVDVRCVRVWLLCGRACASDSLQVGPQDMVDHIVPTVVKAYLNADRATLDFWLSEDAFARTNAALKARDVANLIVDPTLLEVSSCEVVSTKVPERGEPMIICQVMCQQINCTRNREGEIVEGSENEIRAVIYAFVMQVCVCVCKGLCVRMDTLGRVFNTVSVHPYCCVAECVHRAQERGRLASGGAWHPGHTVVLVAGRCACGCNNTATRQRSTLRDHSLQCHLNAYCS